MNSFRWGYLALLSAAVMVTVSLETLPAGILPAMSAEFSQSGSGIGRLVSVWGFTVILTSLPLVRLFARWDRRTVTSLCLAITGLFSLGTALAPSYPIALLSRVLGGASHGLFWALVVVYAAALTPPRFLAAGIALVTGGSQLAAALVIPAAATLVEHVPWRMIYAAIAVLAVAIAVTIRLLLPADEPAPVMAQGTATSPWREPRLAGPATLAVVALFFVFSHFVVYTYATVFFTVDGSADPRLGTYLAVIGVASILGLIVSGPLAGRWPRYGLVAYLLIFAGAMLLIVPTAPGARLPGLALWGLMFGVIGPAAQALALRFTPEGFRPTISAAMVVTFNLGISLGSFTGGILVDSVGAHATAYLAAGALTFAAGLAAWAGPRLREDPREVNRL
ncbi:MAG TPA: MFS transporter [Beutenbergiaceae bacterium]|nr:MFS transporter [Beutenbergiaceae bacterium]